MTAEHRLLLTNMSATVAPTASDDVRAGYYAGSMWLDTVTRFLYFCVNSAVGAAVWINTTMDFYTEVRKGNIAGHAMVHKFGRNAAVPNGVWEFVSNLRHTGWPLSAATTVRVKAGDVADTAAGAGAREITVQGIDDSFNEVTEAIATAGASASSATSTSFWRVHRAWVSAAGVYGNANTAAVTIENGAGGTDVIQIAIGEGQTQFCGWTVPIDKTAYLLGIHFQVDSIKPADFRAFTRENIDDTSAPLSSKRLIQHFDGLAEGFHYVPRAPELVLPAKTDIWVEAEGRGGTTEVTAGFEILVIDN